MAVLTFDQLCDDDLRIFFPRLLVLRQLAEDGPMHIALDYGSLERLEADGLAEKCGGGWYRITDDGRATLAGIDAANEATS